MKRGVVLNKIARFGSKISSFVLFFFWMTRFGHKILVDGIRQPTYLIMMALVINVLEVFIPEGRTSTANIQISKSVVLHKNL